MANLDFNTDISVDGKILIGNVPNQTGAFLILSSIDNKTIVQRTGAEIISDYNLATISATASNLGITYSATNATVSNSNGTGFNISSATASQAGLLSASDKSYLNNLPASLLNFVTLNSNQTLTSVVKTFDGTKIIRVASDFIKNNSNQVRIASNDSGFITELADSGTIILTKNLTSLYSYRVEFYVEFLISGMKIVGSDNLPFHAKYRVYLNKPQNSYSFESQNSNVLIDKSDNFPVTITNQLFRLFTRASNINGIAIGTPAIDWDNVTVEILKISTRNLSNIYADEAEGWSSELLITESGLTFNSTQPKISITVYGDALTGYVPTNTDAPIYDVKTFKADGSLVKEFKRETANITEETKSYRVYSGFALRTTGGGLILKHPKIPNGASNINFRARISYVNYGSNNAASDTVFFEIDSILQPGNNLPISSSLSTNLDTVELSSRFGWANDTNNLLLFIGSPGDTTNSYWKIDYIDIIAGSNTQPISDDFKIGWSLENFTTETQWSSITNDSNTSINIRRIATRNWVNGQGFLTSFTETDPTVPTHVKNILASDITNWNTAFTNNHTHANKPNLDTINQNLSTTSDVQFGKILSATSKGDIRIGDGTDSNQVSIGVNNTFTNGKAIAIGAWPGGTYLSFQNDSILHIGTAPKSTFNGYNTGFSNAIMVIGNNGNVAIGGALAGQKLAVYGSAFITGAFTLQSLAGTGTRMVVADASGNIGVQAITTGTVTSVGLTMPTGFTVSGSPITSSGTFAVTLTSGYNLVTDAEKTTWNGKFNTPTGTTAQYIRGDGSLATFPEQHTHPNKQILDQINQTDFDYFRKGMIYYGHPLSRGIVPKEGETFIYRSTEEDDFIDLIISNLSVSGYSNIDEIGLRKSYADIHPDLKDLNVLAHVMLPVNISKPSVVPFFKSDGSILEIPYTRTGPKTLWNSEGKLIEYPANIPGVAYDPATGKLLGHMLLVAFTNLIIHSNGSNPLNTLSNFSTGTFRTDKGILTNGLVSTTSNGSIGLQQITKASATVDYIFSFYFENQNLSNSITGLSLTVTDGTANTPTISNVNIYDCGGGIYRYVCKILFVSGGTVINISINKTGALVWKLTGFNLLNSNMTLSNNVPYIPTTTTTVTKGAETGTILFNSTFFNNPVNKETIVINRTCLAKNNIGLPHNGFFGFNLSGTYGVLFHAYGIPFMSLGMNYGPSWNNDLTLIINNNNSHNSIETYNNGIYFVSRKTNTPLNIKASVAGSVWSRDDNNPASLTYGLGENTAIVGAKYILLSYEHYSDNNVISEYTLHNP